VNEDLKGRFGGGSGGGDVTFKVESEFLKGKGLIGSERWNSLSNASHVDFKNV